MSAFIFSSDEQDAFTVRKAVFRMILSRAKGNLSDPSDIEQLDIAEVMEGLSFHRLDDEQRIRLTEAVLEGTRGLQSAIKSGQVTEEPVRAGIEELLNDLLVFLSSHARSQ
jgi:hypothetical protein